jgi:hypothetical protein
VALDFVNSNGTKYQWNLHDKKRNSDIRGYARQAAFVNLRRGRYIFSVTAANHNNVWNTTGASLDIRILPPPWFRWYAWLVYGLLLLLLLMAYRRFLVRRASLHTALEVERIEKEKVLELDHMKSRFFANI